MDCLRDEFAGGVLLNGRYQTISPLNHGSFGMVFVAQDLTTNENVAIKCLTKASGPNALGIEFAVDEKSEEFALHSRLGSHNNIVNLIDSFETEAHVYLVLEYCAQGDLYEAIRRGHGPLETEHVRQFMIELVDAVAYIHSKGVYHRDIKPENIFLGKDGAMKLGDFGLATTDKWSYEMTVGSDRYMAPEQFDSAGAGYSPAEVDIWAIGICLLNILFSRNPFTTPTEADPLFLDFSRDKQSLFDVFPSMSQDTYEVIVQFMNLDPRRRSLEGARRALLRVASFTTEDESLDDFCNAETAAIASANREPLRTPSLQNTAQFDGGAFPWAKALHGTPRGHVRQLSIIPDNESYTEDLFSKSGETADWLSVGAKTPSSVLEPSLDKSMKALAIHSAKGVSRPKAATGSLPINMQRPFNMSMASVFGRRDEAVSKSWSDMWDEDEEEEELEKQRENLQQLNARTWSHESVREVPRKSGLDNVTIVDDISGDVDEDLVADGFFFHEPTVPKQPPSAMAAVVTPKYSPPSKRHNLDKWSALGDRRRAQNVFLDNDKSPSAKPSRRHFGMGNKSYEAGVLDHSSIHSKFWTKEQRARDCPWNEGRDWNPRRDTRRGDVGDIEWVGGW